jgi:GAF domain-containing protein
LVSLICAPMLRDGRMIGALHVGNRHPTAFGETDAALLSALAAQASVAIDNARRATVVRCLLVPAVIALLGRASW